MSVICKPELETMCDPYNEGIFACLERNVAKLKGKCLDTFVACRHHIDAAASGTGEVRVSLAPLLQGSALHLALQIMT